MTPMENFMFRRLRPISSRSYRTFTRMRLTRLEDRLAPAFLYWDGGGPDNNWTTAANWAGDVVPRPGDDLIFPKLTASRFTNVNDFPAGTVFHSIRLDNSDYDITGNPVTLAAGIAAVGSYDIYDPKAAHFGLDITLLEPQTFSTANYAGLTLTGAIDLNGQTLTASPTGPFGHKLVFTGMVRGAGGLIVDGGGTVLLGAANTYTGRTDVRAGRLQHSSGTALGAIGVGNDTTVGPNGVLSTFNADQDTFPEAITFAGHAAGKPSLEYFRGTLSGTLTLAGPNYFAADGLTISGVVGETGGAQELTLFSGTAGTQPLGEGRIVFAPGSVLAYTGGTKILHGEQRFDSTTTAPVDVQAGLVAGDGTVGPVTLTSSGGIAPARTADDPLSNLTIAGNLTYTDFTPLGLTIVHFLPDGRSDGVTVRGAVRLNGILQIPRGGNAAAVPAGTHFRIIDNDGTDPVVGSFLGMPEGTIVGSAGGRYLRITYRGGDGNDVDLVADAVEAPGRIAVGAGPGGLPAVNLYDGGGTLLRSFLAYDASFRGGVRVATADLSHDGVPEIITAPGPGGGPHIRIFDGITGMPLVELMAYDPAFRGGVFLATGDTNGDNVPDIITGAGAGGGPHVKVFDGDLSPLGPPSVPSLLRSFFAYDARFAGGVTVAAGDTNGDGRAEVITGAGAGGGPHVRVFDVATERVVREFFAYDPTFTGGVFVAAGDVDGDGKADVVTGTGVGGGPHVRAFSGTTGAVLGEFFAYPPTFTGGVVVDAVDVDGDNRAEIITGPGPGGGPHIREFDLSGTVRHEWFAFDPAFRSGVFIG
jgi:autotransporter-associated beta strand protein